MRLPAMARVTKIDEKRLEALSLSNPVFAPGVQNYVAMGGVRALWHGDLQGDLQAELLTALDQTARPRRRGARWPVARRTGHCTRGCRLNTMPAGPARNQWVAISDVAWQRLAATAPDAQARDIVAHWQARCLPVVVCTQPPGLAPGRLAVGLPAPLRWSRRRLALQVALDQVLRQGEFPPLAAVLQDEASQALAHALAAQGANTRVYGSHGWQALTGEPYVHAASDIDVQIQVPGFEAARQALPLLQQARLPGRLDGEFAFPGGQAIAWREFAHLLQPAQPAAQVLVKSLGGPRLMPAAWVRQLGLAAT
jgi:phosphoribosyl-dephospho-CoA transferase